LVADRPAATPGEDGRTVSKTCALLLVTLGGRTSDAATVRSDAGPDRAVAGSDVIDRWWFRLAVESSTADWSKEEEEVAQKVGR
jgi:hypothetical protein